MRTLVAGHLCLDITPTLPGPAGLTPGQLYAVGPARTHIGGSVANTGGALARLGVEVSAYACVGDDPFGRLIADELTSLIGPRTHLSTSTAATSYSLVVEPPGSDRTFWHHEGSNATFDPSTILADLPGHDLVHVGYPGLMESLWRDGGTALARAYAAAQQQRIATSLDVACVDPQSPAGAVDWQAWLATVGPHLDLITPSWDDMVSMGWAAEPFTHRAAETAADALLATGVRIVYLSAGAEGFLLRTAQTPDSSSSDLIVSLDPSWWGRCTWFPATAIDHPVTTTGAGDTLTAGLLHALLQRLGLDAAGAHAHDIVRRHLRGMPLREAPQEAGQ